MKEALVLVELAVSGANGFGPIEPIWTVADVDAPPLFAESVTGAVKYAPVGVGGAGDRAHGSEVVGALTCGGHLGLDVLGVVAGVIADFGSVLASLQHAEVDVGHVIVAADWVEHRQARANVVELRVVRFGEAVVAVDLVDLLLVFLLLGAESDAFEGLAGQDQDASVDEGDVGCAANGALVEDAGRQAGVEIFVLYVELHFGMARVETRACLDDNINGNSFLHYLLNQLNLNLPCSIFVSY